MKGQTAMTEYVIGKFKNQSFSIEQDDISISFRLRTYRGIIYMEVYDGDELIRANIRCVNNQFLLTKEVEDHFGCNVKFVDKDGDYPNSDNFDGFKCKFYLYTKKELILERGV